MVSIKTTMVSRSPAFPTTVAMPPKCCPFPVTWRRACKSGWIRKGGGNGRGWWNQGGGRVREGKRMNERDRNTQRERPHTLTPLSSASLLFFLVILQLMLSVWLCFKSQTAICRSTPPRVTCCTEVGSGDSFITCLVPSVVDDGGEGKRERDKSTVWWEYAIPERGSQGDEKVRRKDNNNISRQMAAWIIVCKRHIIINSTTRSWYRNHQSENTLVYTCSIGCRFHHDITGRRNRAARHQQLAEETPDAPFTGNIFEGK